MRTEDRFENRLEKINGNSILLGTNLQGEKLVLATVNSVGATVGLRERLFGGVESSQTNTYSAEAKAAGTRVRGGAK